MRDSKTVEEWKRYFERQHSMLRELLLDEDEELVDLKEYNRRLYVKYGITREEDDSGDMHYTDSTVEWRSEKAKDEEFVNSVITRENVPVLQGIRMIEIGRHPDDLDDPKQRAKKQVDFNESVDKVFQQQLENQDNPFPLEYPLREEN